MRLDDPLPENNKQPEDCESCQHPMPVLKFYRTNDFTRKNGPLGHWLCDLCATTMTSVALEYPEQFREGRDAEIMRTVCFVGNAVIAAARGPSLFRALKLLAEAKRMAEFGDINEDMEDDGVGWKQWYLDVTQVLKEAGFGNG
jgi:hypothetical protein